MRVTNTRNDSKSHPRLLHLRGSSVLSLREGGDEEHMWGRLSGRLSCTPGIMSRVWNVYSIENGVWSIENGVWSKVSSKVRSSIADHMRPMTAPMMVQINGLTFSNICNEESPVIGSNLIGKPQHEGLEPVFPIEIFRIEPVIEPVSILNQCDNHH